MRQHLCTWLPSLWRNHRTIGRSLECRHKAQDFRDILSGETVRASSLTATDPRHIAMSSPGQSRFDDVAAPDQANPNGNAVSLEEEMIKVSDTQAQFQAAANLYAKAMTMMKTAIGH